MKKLLCVVVDGLRADALACAHAGCLERLCRQGINSSSVLSVRSGRTLPALCTILTSRWPEEHGVITNGGLSLGMGADMSLTALLHARQQDVSLFYSRDSLEQLIPSRQLHSSYFINSQRIRNVDMQLASAAAIHLQTEQPELCLLHIDGVDIAGHNFGFMTEPYLEAVETADHCIALILEELRVVGLSEEYVIMVLSDHGGIGYEHDRKLPEVCTIPWIIHGPGIVAGGVFNDDPTLVDIAPTMAEILNIPMHPDWQGKVRREIFKRGVEFSTLEENDPFHYIGRAINSSPV